jgi:hypothetical protein
MIARTAGASTRTASRAWPREALLLGLATFSMVAWQAGVYVDVWYHIHRGVQIESFFTWAHGLLYGGWALAGLVVASYSAWGAGSLPHGYRTFALGVAMFGLGGLIDMVWHTAFGVEVGQQAVLSPAHLWLAASFTVAAIGLCEAAARWRAGSGSGSALLTWSDLPLILTFGMLFRVMGWYAIYANPLTIDFASGGAVARTLPAFSGFAWDGAGVQVAGTTGMLLHAALLALFVVVPLRHLRLPSGSIAVIMLYDALMIAPAADQWLALPAVAGAAVIGETVWALVRRGAFAGPDGEAGYWLLGGLVPLVQFALSFVLLDLFGGGIVWSVHLATGVPVASAIVGLSVAVLAVPPAFITRPRDV